MKFVREVNMISTGDLCFAGVAGFILGGSIGFAICKQTYVHPVTQEIAIIETLEAEAYDLIKYAPDKQPCVSERWLELNKKKEVLLLAKAKKKTKTPMVSEVEMNGHTYYLVSDKEGKDRLYSMEGEVHEPQRLPKDGEHGPTQPLHTSTRGD